MSLNVADNLARQSRNRDLGMIHLLARKAKLSRPKYEKLVEEVTGRRSAKELSQIERNRLMNRLHELAERDPEQVCA